jgi:hypothetical protein
VRWLLGGAFVDLPQGFLPLRTYQHHLLLLPEQLDRLLAKGLTLQIITTYPRQKLRVMNQIFVANQTKKLSVLRGVSVHGPQLRGKQVRGYYIFKLSFMQIILH